MTTPSTSVLAAGLAALGLVLTDAALPSASPPVTPEHAPAPPPETEAPADHAALKEVFPGVFLDETTKTIELPGKIPIINKAADNTVVFLEQLVCTPNTKEHEVLVVVTARPSHVHAALLLLGLEPGKPADWKAEGTKLIPIPPSGPELEIEFVYNDEQGVEHTAKPTDWVINFKNREEHLPERFPVFAGSAIRKLANGRERYYADSEGTLIGLATFGTEVIAWPEVFLHESSQHEPEWIANPEMPPLNTEVRVRIRPHEKEKPAPEAPADENPSSQPDGTPTP